MIIFDLDGTLADIEHRRHLVSNGNNKWDEFFEACVDDKPNYPAIMTMVALVNEGHEVEIWSGRDDIVRPQTERWLNKHLSPYLKRRSRRPHLVMRRHGDNTPDQELKLKWLEGERRNGVKVELVFDDRDKVVKMWREQGIPCFQVAPGDF